ncbi:GerAB/ArcD/ProY family transporter [Clostridium ganghwense]|uniref:Endospore germination permease n=1 Tax=Clostridium ganghwense TaxID=312089 RepID=A0ABT4CS13_9CLOT|nr:endospore germination permease [Clostridium ganghwense]MCY6371856.1 endospore germination permease [Clostridium ganghwense]
MSKLNCRHFIFIILGTTIVGLKTYPNLIIQHAVRDSWIAVSIASVLIFLFTIYILWICKKTNTYNLSEIYNSALGKILGPICLFFFILTLFLTLIESSSIESNALRENLLLDTPSWYILLFFILIAIYSINKGLRALLMITIFAIITIMFAGINLGIMTTKYKQSKYLFPILENGLDLNFWIGTLKSLGCYSSIAIFLPFLVDINKKERHKLIKNSIIALIIVIQMQIISMTGIITTFGPKRALSIWYPKLIQTQLVSYFGFLESGEFFVMLQMVGGWFIKYILTFYAFLNLLKEFNISNEYNIYISSSAVLLSSFFISRNIFTLYKFLDYYIYISLINFIAVPLIIFTIFLIKYKLNSSSKNN